MSEEFYQTRCLKTPVLSALIQLFSEIDHNKEQRKSTMPVISVDNLRFELFIAAYLQGEFELYQHADACEAYNFILSLIHASLQCIQSMDEGKITCKEINLAVEKECKPKCIVHRDLRLRVKRVKQCRCLPMVAESAIEEYDINNFSQVIYVQDIRDRIENDMSTRKMLKD